MDRYTIIAQELNNETNEARENAKPVGLFTGVVAFFRSDKQAEGKAGSGAEEKTGSGAKQKVDPDTDTTYKEDFGFDTYRPNLYGTSKEEYKIVSDVSYLKKIKKGDEEVAFALKADTFKLNKKTASDTINNIIEDYCIPWIYVPNKEITIQAKIMHIKDEKNYKEYKKGKGEKTEKIYFSIAQTDENFQIRWTDNEKTVVSKYNGNIITTDKKEFDFDIGDDDKLVPLKIKVTEKLIQNYALVAYYKYNDIEYLLGQLNFWRYTVSTEKQNDLDENNLSFNPDVVIPLKIIELRVNNQTKTLTPSVATNLQQALRIFEYQAGIEINVLPTVGFMNIEPESTDIDKKFNTHGKIAKNSAGVYVMVDTSDTEFHKELVRKIFLKNETVKQRFIHTIFEGAYPGKQPFINIEGKKKTLSELMPDTDYRKFFLKLIDYISYSMIFCFVSPDIIARTSAKSNEEVGAGVLGSGITVITKTAISDYKDVYVHEIGHNLNLNHTFKQNDNQGKPMMTDFGLNKAQTKENYMDYDIKPNAIVKKQWDIANNQKVDWVIEKDKAIFDMANSLALTIYDHAKYFMIDEKTSNEVLDRIKPSVIRNIENLLSTNTYQYGLAFNFLVDDNIYIG
ncbi:MAG TPA: hypothetical protein VF677_13025 [Flavobacterium sp.]|jgi:hypothetical protein